MTKRRFSLDDFAGLFETNKEFDVAVKCVSRANEMINNPKEPNYQALAEELAETLQYNKLQWELTSADATQLAVWQITRDKLAKYRKEIGDK